MNKIKKAALSLALSVCLLGGGHYYLGWMIENVIQTQIESNKDRIKKEMKDEILRSLENDEETQLQVQGLMQRVVARELEDNGDVYIQQIIKKKYPFLANFLASQEQKTN